MICVLLECRMAFVAFLNCCFLPEAACARVHVCGCLCVSVCVDFVSDAVADTFIFHNDVCFQH